MAGKVTVHRESDRLTIEVLTSLLGLIRTLRYQVCLNNDASNTFDRSVEFISDDIDKLKKSLEETI